MTKVWKTLNLTKRFRSNYCQSNCFCVGKSLKCTDTFCQLNFILEKKLCFREWDDKSPTERYSFIGHHLTAFMSFWWILANNQLLFFGCHRLMAELSTPILNAMVISENIPNLPPVIKDVLKISFSIIFISCRMFTAPFFWRLGTI